MDDMLENMMNILDNSDEAIYVTDFDYNILYVNQAVCSAVRAERGHILGSKCYQRLMRRDTPCPFCNMEEVGGEQFLIRKFHHPILDKFFELRGKKIRWNGRTAHIEFARDINAQHLMERQNQILLKQLQDVFDHIPSGVCLYRYQNDTLNPIIHNKGFWLLFGYTESQRRVVERRTEYLNVHPDDRAVLKAAIDECARTITPFSQTCRVFHELKQKYIWIKIDAITVSQDDGTTLFYINFSDNTELIESTNNLEGFMKTISGGIAVYSVEDKLKTLMFTDGIPRMQGFTREEYRQMIDDDALSIVYEGDRDRLRATIEQSLRSVSFFHTSYRVYCKDRSLIWINVSAYPYGKSRTGYPIYNAVFTNVSVQFDLYRNIADFSEIGLLVTDKTTREIYYANDKVYELTGMDKAAFNGQNCYELLDCQDEVCGGCESQEQQKVCDRYMPRSAKELRIISRELKWMGRPSIVRYLSDITAEAQYQHTIERERERYRLIVEKSGIALLDYDFTTGTYFANEGYAQYAVSQLSQAAVMTNTADLSTVHPDDIPLLMRFFDDCRTGSETAEAKLRVKMTDGSYRWTIMQGLFLYDDNGELCRSIGTFQDVDDVTRRYDDLKKRYEYEVARQNVQSSDAIESTCLDAATGKIIDCFSKTNANVKLMIGRTASELFEQGIVTALDERSQKELREFLNRENFEHCYRLGITAEIEYQRRSVNNPDAIWIKSVAYPVKEPQTGALLVFIYTYDIDRRKTTEQMIKRIVESNFELALLISARTGRIKLVVDAGDGMKYVADQEEYDVQLNKNLKCANQSERETLLEEISLAGLRAGLSKAASYSGSCTVMEGDKNARKLWSATYFDQTKNQILLTFSDITEVYLADMQKTERLRAALSAAMVADKAKMLFLARMSHEIRTPINAISGIMELIGQDLNNETPDRDKLCEYNQDAIVAIRYLLTLINDILDMAKIESGQISLVSERLNVTRCLVNINKMIVKMAEQKGIHYKYVCPEYLAADYLGDSVRFQQIIINLLNNAVKFTPSGGNVTLTLEATSCASDKTELKAIVTDTGVGVGAEFQPLLFEPFMQEYDSITSSYGGTGLGLPISRKLARLMGGDIVCESVKGQGAKFTATVVVSKIKKGQNGNSMGDWQAGFSIAGLHVLVCEDHPLNQKIIRALLENKGCDVTMADNGREGLELFADSKIGEYDIILMDIRMPVLDGLRASKAIRGLARPDARNIPIVAMSANAFEEDRRASLAAGIDEHLAKPIDVQKLYRTIAEFVRNRSGC